MQWLGVSVPISRRGLVPLSISARPWPYRNVNHKQGWIQDFFYGGAHLKKFEKSLKHWTKLWKKWKNLEKIGQNFSEGGGSLFSWCSMWYSSTNWEKEFREGRLNIKWITGHWIRLQEKSTQEFETFVGLVRSLGWTRGEIQRRCESLIYTMYIVVLVAYGGRTQATCQTSFYATIDSQLLAQRKFRIPFATYTRASIIDALVCQNELLMLACARNFCWCSSSPLIKNCGSISHKIGLYKPNQVFQICLWCTQILFTEIEPVEHQYLSKEIKILHRLSGSVYKSVIGLRGLNEKNRDVEG